jgi:hypothetical protein
MKVNIKVERWDFIEFQYQGQVLEASFFGATIKGIFIGENENKVVEGFYDGAGIYKIRFMPSFVGMYRYRIEGDFSEQRYEGVFEVTEPQKGNHGPVRVANTFHFAYMDGTPYYQIGTTCYGWVHQPKEMQIQTLNTLKETSFNKLRFCVFPKHYDFNLDEPECYPYEGTPCDASLLTRDNFSTYLPSNPENKWNFERFNPTYFAKIEENIQALLALGIEADIILFHPYDRWGFSEMGQKYDQDYMRYVIARFASFRNVWWSLANEYDLCKDKVIADWEGIAETLVRYDPYQHLRSIHNCKNLYDFSRPWITHCSIQRTNIYVSATYTKMWREQFYKPIVLDEVGYEGNINYNWGNLTAEEMVRLFWASTIRGGYCGHGETYMAEDQKLWWSHGNVLKGESSKRIDFLHTLLTSIPGHGLEPANILRWDDGAATATHLNYRGRYFLFYTEYGRPSFREFDLRSDREYIVEVIDTWNMTIENRGIFSGKFTIDLPSRQYMLLRIQEKELFKVS